MPDSETMETSVYNHRNLNSDKQVILEEDLELPKTQLANTLNLVYETLAKDLYTMPRLLTYGKEITNIF